MKWFKWSKGGPLPVPNFEPEPPMYRFTRGWSCGEHSSSEYNHGVCADCGDAVRPCVIRQFFVRGFSAGYMSYPDRWAGATFVRWDFDKVEPANDPPHS